MANLSEVQVGGKLRLELEVREVGLNIVRAAAASDSGPKAGVWIPESYLEAAEYIPPPRTFKRGDWVKHHSIGRGGLFLYVAPSNDSEAIVHFPDCGVQRVWLTRLEPDEAPE